MAGALQLAKATKELDAAAIVRLTLPDLVASVGGDEKMRAALERKFAEGKSVGMVVDSISIGQPTQMGYDGDTRYIFFPYTTVAHTKTNRITDRAFYLAISDDSGKTWSYVDGVRLTEDVVRQAFVRGYNGQPPLPKRERVVEPN